MAKRYQRKNRFFAFGFERSLELNATRRKLYRRKLAEHRCLNLVFSVL